MTDKYHPVTKEELEQIHRLSGCYDYDEMVTGIHEILKEVSTRPDPLALLEAWRKHERSVNDRRYYEAWILEYEFIKQLRTNPEAVREQGIEDGWWKDE
jgi:hypothetical protein